MAISDPVRRPPLPRYRDLAQRLHTQISRGQLLPGDRLPSFRQMQRDWGTNQKTVEQAYALLEQDGLISRRHGSGVYVAESLSATSTGVLAVASPSGFPRDHPYFMRLLNGVHDSARALKREVMLLHEDSVIDAGKFDGLLICDDGPHRFLKRVPPSTPFVSLLHPLEHAHCVTVDDRTAMRDVVLQMAALGHRHIGYVTVGRSEPNGIGALRFAGYRDGLVAAAIEMDESLVRPGKQFYASVLNNRDFGYNQMKQWLRADWCESGCTAVLAHSDDTAMGILDALQEAGIRVPQDVSVVGFDGLGLWHPLCGPIDSVKVPLYEIGARGARLLIEGAGQEPVVLRIPATYERANSSAEVKRT